MDRIYILGRDIVPEAVSLAAGEHLSLALVALPGCSADCRLEVCLDGEGAELEISGLYICKDRDRVKLDVDVRHNVPGCVSNQVFRGIVAGEAGAEFDGLVYVAPGAGGTKAHQENHTILLDRGARAESRPQLEIYADDVECSHGATTGFLDEDELFYMRSRGIPEDEAKRLQILSFLSPVMKELPEDIVKVVESSL